MILKKPRDIIQFNKKERQQKRGGRREEGSEERRKEGKVKRGREGVRTSVADLHSFS